METARSPFRYAGRMQRLKVSAIRELLKLTERPEIISFAGGLPAPELFPVADFGRACAETLREDGGAALQYGTTEGYGPLRGWVCEELARVNGIVTSSEHVLIVPGPLQGLHLVAQVLLDPCDLVVVEHPPCLGALQAFEAYEAKFLDIAPDGDGMLPDALRDALAAAPRRPKLLYLVANFANPTGITTSLERRRAIVEIAREFEIPVFEDDPYGRLRYSGEALPSLVSLPGAGGVLYAGTASKTIAPGIRVAGRSDGGLEKLVMAKQAVDLHDLVRSARDSRIRPRPGALDQSRRSSRCIARAATRCRRARQRLRRADGRSPTAGSSGCADRARSARPRARARSNCACLRPRRTVL